MTSTSYMKAAPQLPGRSRAETKARRHELLGDTHRKWTAWEDKILTEHTTDEAVELLERSRAQIQNRRSRQKIKAPRDRPRVWTDQEDAIVSRRPILEAQTLLGLGVRAITARRRALGVTSRADRWSAREEAIVYQNTAAEAHKLLGGTRSLGAIQTRRSRVIRAAATTTEETK